MTNSKHIDSIENRLRDIWRDLVEGEGLDFQDEAEDLIGETAQYIATITEEARIELVGRIYANLRIEKPKPSIDNSDRTKVVFAYHSVDGLDVIDAIENALTNTNKKG
jgi:hypothetical protein